MSLISVDSLAEHLADYRLVDCRFSLADTALGEQQFHQGHIPGAVYAHLDRDLSSEITPNSGRHPLPDFDALAQQLGEWGIDRDTIVVAYDDSTGFHAYASRLWWLLRTLGHRHVAVLDGGYDAWQAAGLKSETSIVKPERRHFLARLDPAAWRDTGQVQSCLEAKSCMLIDARAKQRFDGELEPIDPVAGHIPGSVNMPITENIDANGCVLPAEVLQKNYLALMGATPPEQVLHSCGSGVFACFGILAMELAGLNGSKLYPGSWSEWIRDPARGVATAS